MIDVLKKFLRTRNAWYAGAAIILILILFLLSRGAKEPAEVFVTRNFETTAEDEHMSFLTDVPEDQLTAIRCTMPFVNDGHDVFFWRLPYQHDLFEEVADTAFVTAIQSVQKHVPAEQILLSGRFCEAENNTIYFDYYIADKALSTVEFGYYDGKDVHGYISTLGKDMKPIDPFEFIHEDYWLYATCNPMLQLTNQNQVYLSCGVQQTYTATSNLLKIDMNSQTISALVTCEYDRVTDFKRICRTIEKDH